MKHRISTIFLGASLLAACQPAFGQSDRGQNALSATVAELRETVRDLRQLLLHLESSLEQMARNPELKAGVAPATGAPEGETSDFHWRQAQKSYSEGIAAASRELWSVAIGHFSETVRADPSNDAAYLHRARCYFKLNEYRLAESDVTQSLRLQPNNGGAYLLRAEVYSATGQVGAATADLDEVLARNTSDRRAYLMRAELYRGAGQWESALGSYSQAVKLSPDAPTQAVRCQMLLSLGHSDEAREAATAAIQMDPKSAVARSCRGLALLGRGKTKEAIEDLEQAVALNSTDEAAKTSLANARQMALAPAAVPGAPAIPVADAPKPAVQSAEAQKLIETGRALTSRGQFKDAVAAFNRAIELDPNRALAYNSRGYAFLRLKDCRASIQDFDAAVRLNPLYANAYLNRAVARRLMGDKGYLADLSSARMGQRHGQ